MSTQSVFKKLWGYSRDSLLASSVLSLSRFYFRISELHFSGFLACFCRSPFLSRLIYWEIAKKKACQNVRVPRVLSGADRDLYGWVDGEVLSQPSVVEADTLPELRREMRLAADRAAEGDYVLEAAGPSDKLPFQAPEDRTPFLWVYAELFTRLGVRLPFTGFQKEVMTRCRVVASQLHLNGWGFLLTFECVCLHFGFRPFWRESIQEFKWHYFKVLPFPGRRPFWLDDGGTPFPWVYWNFEVGDYRITALDPLETLAFEFLHSLPADSLLEDMDKQSRFDHLRAKMAEIEAAGPRSILPTPAFPATPAGPSASVSAAAVPQAPSSGAVRTKKKPPVTSSVRPISLEKEEGCEGGPFADLKQKRRKRKAQESYPEEAALGADSAWEHEVNPIDREFPTGFNFRGALDSGLTQGPIREILGPVVPEQLLGTIQQLGCNLTACLQVGIENAFAAKVKTEKELAAAKDQVDVLTAERDSALAAPLLKEKIDSLTEQLRLAEGERLSALTRMSKMEDGSKVQDVELQSCRSALEQEKKKVESLTQSSEQKQTALGEAEAAVGHWREEWKALAEETGEMVQGTFDILMDQVFHLNPAVDYSMITLDTHWDPQARRIYNPKAETQE
ncbi:hypothetical protein PIB30_083308 [Stylosanthes scabra]|uniref:Aminotransferase-like plant mobile domain-containing protein n=1 Tax=Stylosanthes scabra TaxID=79078 RepID=A0ABU6YPU6_9FABA|nr:hypothetical protein [Stylosanthes scabra]